MNKYRKKPIVIEAAQWTGKLYEEIKMFCPTAHAIYDGRKIAYLLIPTLEGNMQCGRGDWIIKGVKGEFYPCKLDIFKATYEPVDEACKKGDVK